MQTTKVGIRESRQVPTKPKPRQEDLEALRIAGEKMKQLIEAAGTNEDEIVEDFTKLRRS